MLLNEYRLSIFSEGPHSVTPSGPRIKATSSLKLFLSSPTSRCHVSAPSSALPFHVSWSSLVFKEKLPCRAVICILLFLLQHLQKKAPVSNCPHGPPQWQYLAYSNCSTNIWLVSKQAFMDPYATTLSSVSYVEIVKTNDLITILSFQQGDQIL